MSTHRTESAELRAPAAKPSTFAWTPTRSALVAGLALSAGIVLAVLIHWLLIDSRGQGLALVIAAGGLTAAGVAASLGSSHRVAALLVTAVGVGSVLWAWDWLLAHVDWIYLAQHAGSHVVLGLWFGGSLISLRNGTGDALITRWATRLHGTLPPSLRRYTAQITALWAGYFWLMALASMMLFAFGSTTAWSILANLVTLPLIVAIFLVEYRVRIRLHPDFEHASILDGVRAFMK